MLKNIVSGSSVAIFLFSAYIFDFINAFMVKARLIKCLL